MTVTQSLGALIGVYFIAAGIGLLVERDNLNTMFKELVDQPMFGYMAGVVAFVIGGAMVTVHNDWSGLLAGFVTLVGWAALAEGVLMLSVRRWFLGLFESLVLSSRLVAGMGAATVVGGVVVLWAAVA